MVEIEEARILTQLATTLRQMSDHDLNLAKLVRDLFQYREQDLKRIEALETEVRRLRCAIRPREVK